MPTRSAPVPAVLSLALLALPACVCDPAPADWLAAGAGPYRTPEQAFRTFRTAFAGDVEELEYRSFSADFRRRNGLSELVWRQFRKDLLAEEPWLRRLSCARVVEARRLSPLRAEVVGEVRTLFRTDRFTVGLVREDFYELRRGDELLGDGYLDDLSDAVRERPSPGGTPGLALWLPLPPAAGAGEVTEVLVGSEWKIDSLTPLDERGDTERDPKPGEARGAQP